MAGFDFFSSGPESGRHDYSDAAIEPWVWEGAFGDGGALRGAKVLLAKGNESYSNEPHISGGVLITGVARIRMKEINPTSSVSGSLGPTGEGVHRQHTVPDFDGYHTFSIKIGQYRGNNFNVLKSKSIQFTVREV